jgi:hypothetical protein
MRTIAGVTRYVPCDRTAVIGAFLAAAAASVMLCAPAHATTWDLSTLNVTATTGPRPPHFPICPCTDQTTGTVIFNASNGQLNGWTMGADTLYFMGNGRGNNAAKIISPPAVLVSPFRLGKHSDLIIRSLRATMPPAMGFRSIFGSDSQAVPALLLRSASLFF